MTGPLMIMHKPRLDSYAEWNSRQGILRTQDLGANAQDLDVCLDASGVLEVTHGPNPFRRDGFRDPRGHIAHRKQIKDLHRFQVARLRTRAGYRIEGAAYISGFAQEHGITPCFEAKPDERLTDPKFWKQLDHGIVMAQPHGGLGIEMLEAANKAGRATLLLARGPVPPEWWIHLDYVKAPEKWAADRPSWVKRIGVGPRDATMHGAGCHPGNVAQVRAAIKRAGGWSI